METLQTNFQALLEHLSSREKKNLVIAGAVSREVLSFCEMAGALCNFILVGEEAKFRELKPGFNLPEESYRFIPANDSKTQSLLAVKAVAEGRGNLLMKGSVKTGDLMKAALSKETGLGRDRLLSHILTLEKPRGGFLLVTDGGMVIAPTLDEKIGILENALEISRGLGVHKPRIWLDSLSDANLADAGQISLRAQEGRFGEVEILFSRDPDYFPEHFDIALLPGLEAGNITGKTLMYLCRLNGGLLVAGARVPIVVTSRADTAQTRFNSLVLCLYLSGSMG